MFVFMKRVIKVFVLLLFVLQTVASYAQEKYDFVKQAGASAALFRGVEFERYPFRYKDSPYAYSEEFNLGEIVFNDVKYSGVLLNLNAHKDELHLKITTNGKILELDKGLVERFTIGEREYVALIGANAVEGVSEGFYEILYSGKEILFKKNVKKYNERLQSSEQGAYRYFYPSNRYYLLKDGVMLPISSAKQFKKVYKDKKDAISKFIRKNRIRFIDINDKDFIFKEIISFVDNN